MLNRYFIRPTTVDWIRSCWMGEEIERYVAWLSEQNYPLEKDYFVYRR